MSSNCSEVGVKPALAKTWWLQAKTASFLGRSSESGALILASLLSLVEVEPIKASLALGARIPSHDPRNTLQTGSDKPGQIPAQSGRSGSEAPQLHLSK